MMQKKFVMPKEEGGFMRERERERDHSLSFLLFSFII